MSNYLIPSVTLSFQATRAYIPRQSSNIHTDGDPVMSFFEKDDVEEVII